MKNKYINFIAIIYLAVLIVGTIIYYIIPKDGFMEAISSKKIIASEERYRTIIENPAALPDMKKDGETDIESYIFNYEGRDLEIAKVNTKGQIFFGRKSTNDNKIEVYRYKAPTTFQGVDITDKIKEPKIELVNNKLDFVYEKQEYSYMEFPKDVTITQFCKGENDKLDNKYDGRIDPINYSGRGNSIIYIKIPKDLNILNDEYFIYIE